MNNEEQKCNTCYGAGVVGGNTLDPDDNARLCQDCAERAPTIKESRTVAGEPVDRDKLRKMVYRVYDERLEVTDEAMDDLIAFIEQRRAASNSPEIEGIKTVEFDGIGDAPAAAAPTIDLPRFTFGDLIVYHRKNDVDAAITAARQQGEEHAHSQYASLLPGPQYMDLPDGGSVTVFEQLRRMIKTLEAERDAARKTGAQFHQAACKAVTEVADLRAAYDALYGLSGDTIDARNAEIAELRAYRLRQKQQACETIDACNAEIADLRARLASAGAGSVDLSKLARYERTDAGMTSGPGNDGRFVEFDDVRALVAAALARTTNKENGNG